jgi:hypothetical protein
MTNQIHGNEGHSILKRLLKRSCFDRFTPKSPRGSQETLEMGGIPKSIAYRTSAAAEDLAVYKKPTQI